jgi:hypothetical protein
MQMLEPHNIFHGMNASCSHEQKWVVKERKNMTIVVNIKSMIHFGKSL